jgi:hypothetical protein
MSDRILRGLGRSPNRWENRLFGFPIKHADFRFRFFRTGVFRFRVFGFGFFLPVMHSVFKTQRKVFAIDVLTFKNVSVGF